MDGWSVTQWMVTFNVLQQQIAQKKSLKLMLVQSMQVLQMAFKYSISIAPTDPNFAADFGFNQIRMMPEIVSKLLSTAI